MSINTIIVDDEKPARDELAFLLKAFPEINVIGQGKNGVDAVNLIREVVLERGEQEGPELTFKPVNSRKCPVFHHVQEKTLGQVLGIVR